MQTFKAIEITTTGVFYAPEYPKEPELIEREQTETYFPKLYDYGEAVKTAIRYPVKNIAEALRIVFGEKRGTIEEGIYPYDGEVEIEDLSDYEGEELWEISPCKVAILIEPPANVSNNSSSSEPKQEAIVHDPNTVKIGVIGGPKIMSRINPLGQIAKQLKEENESLRASNKELAEALKQKVEKLQSNLSDYKRMRDNYKEASEGYACYDLMVREYRIIIDLFLPLIVKHSNL